MLGAIIGDIVGSRFEWNNIKTKEFDFLTYKCFATDDSIMSLAVAQAILDCNGNYAELGNAAIVDSAGCSTSGSTLTIRSHTAALVTEQQCALAHVVLLQRHWRKQFLFPKQLPK